MKSEQYSTQYEVEKEHWWYRVRRKMVLDIFGRHVQGKKIKILDVGCGTGALMKELRPFGNVYGLDFSEEAIHFCKQRGEKNLFLGSITKIPFPDNYFDAVVALDVLEHVEDDTKALSEIRRVLKNGGTAVIFVPAFKFLWGKADELGCHFRRYTRRDLKKKVEKGNFTIIRSSYFNTFLFPLITGVRLLVRLLHIPIQSENTLGGSFSNGLFYVIFYLESLLLPYISFPFGVSVMIVAEKK
jgi:ubiquinone/menaquinone biosynthesis C-methylase UbiE